MPDRADTIIQFSGLKSGTYDYHYTLDDTFFERFENEELQHGEVEFDVQLEKKERILLLQCTFNGTIHTVCDRCLDDLDIDISGSHLLTFRMVSEKIEEYRTTDDEDVIEIPDSEYQIDLAQWLYEYVFIAMPLQRVHPDDENGDPTCNADMLKRLSDNESSKESHEIDPRWEQLKNLTGE